MCCHSSIFLQCLKIWCNPWSLVSTSQCIILSPKLILWTDWSWQLTHIMKEVFNWLVHDMIESLLFFVLDVFGWCVGFEAHWSLVSCTFGFVVFDHPQRVSTWIKSFLLYFFSHIQIRIVKVLRWFSSSSLCSFIFSLISIPPNSWVECFHAIHLVHWWFVMTKDFFEDWNECILVNKKSLSKTFTCRVKINGFYRTINWEDGSFCFVMCVWFDDCCFLVILLIMLPLAVINTIQEQIFNLCLFSIVKGLIRSQLLIELLLHIKLPFERQNIQVSWRIISIKESKDLLLSQLLGAVFVLKQVLDVLFDLVVCWVDTQFIKLVLGLRKLCEKGLLISCITFLDEGLFHLILRCHHIFLHNVEIC